MITWTLDFIMLWFRASPKYLCALNTRLFHIGSLVVERASEETKGMLDLDWLEAKESIQRFREAV
jgi:hypothetical protein